MARIRYIQFKTRWLHRRGNSSCRYAQRSFLQVLLLVNVKRSGKFFGLVLAKLTDKIVNAADSASANFTRA